MGQPGIAEPLPPLPAGLASSFAASPGLGDASSTAAPATPPSSLRSELAGFGRGGIPQMIGDQGPTPALTIQQFPPPPTPGPLPPPPPPPPSPQVRSALVPTVRGLKIAENQSPRPQDRVFFTFNYFAEVNESLNRRFAAPVSDIRIYRYIFGLEKTFDDGNGSIGLRVPLNTLTSNRRVPGRFAQFGGTSTAPGNLDIFAKYILKQDPDTGSLISAGFAVTPPTAGSTFAGTGYIQTINTTLFQPFLGYLLVRGNFYLQGFTAFEFPVDERQVTEMYNDIGVGYFLYRSPDPGRFLTAVAPTFEVHANSPLNHRDFGNPNDPAGTPDVVNLTYGLNLEIRRNSLLTLGFVTPVTGPRPYDYEALVLFNFRFGGSARRATPPVISG